jgi:ribonuclease P protein component
MRRSADFRAAVRTGRRVRSGTIVVHHRPAGAADASEDAAPPATPALVGFVVGRTVGPSVSRHRVIRRLRHAVQRTVADLPPGSTTVIRALPTAARASWPALAADVTSGLDRVRREKAGAR